MKMLLLALTIGLIAFPQNSQQSSSVVEVAPEPFPIGPCAQGNSGYLGITEHGAERTKLTRSRNRPLRKQGAGRRI
jgi:hypothetical protein